MKSRREFLKTGMSTLGLLALNHPFAKAMATSSQDSVIFVFLRGGADGLSMVMPTQNGALDSSYDVYNAARGPLAIEGSRALAGSPFSIHPSMTNVFSLYNQGKLALVHGAGSPNNTRSHFEQQDLIEHGTPEPQNRRQTGFLNRALLETSGNSDALPGVSIGGTMAESLRGEAPTVAVPNRLELALYLATPGIVSGISLPERIQKGWQSYPEDSNSIERLTHSAGVKTKRAYDRLKEIDGKSITVGDQASYAGFADMRMAALLLAGDPGLKFVSVSVGGWDTHRDMGPNDVQSNGETKPGYFKSLVGRLDKALGQLVEDLKRNNIFNRTTIVVMSEFGRRIAKNGSGGLDHGRGGVMMVIGGKTNGKKVVSESDSNNKWDLNSQENGDVRITVDYRHVFAEILNRRMGIPLADIKNEIFPGFSPKTLNLVKM